MKFVDLFATTDSLEFIEVSTILEAHHITFQTSNESRLHQEWNVESFGQAATIQVQEKDFVKAKNILKRLILEKEASEAERQPTLLKKSSLNTGYSNKEFQSIIGKHLKSVYYIFAEDYEYELDTIHSIGYGIILHFEGDIFLSWAFEEEFVDFENQYYLPDRYDIKYLDSLERFDTDYLKIINVSDDIYWQSFSKRAIQNIAVYSQDWQGHPIITDLYLETKDSKLAILSTPSPEEDEENIRIDLSVGNEWTCVVFDEEQINLLERY